MRNKKIRTLDAHIHSTFSQGECTIEEIVKICAKKKCEAGICDNVSPYNPKLNSERTFSKYLAEMAKHKVMKSAEFDIACGINFSSELLEPLDYVVRGLHHFKNKNSDTWLGFYDPKAKVNDVEYFRAWSLDQLSKTIEGEQVDIIAHPTRLPVSLQDSGKEVYNDKWKSDLIKMASVNEVAFEINHVKHVPDEAFLTECMRFGINIALGSDGRTRAEIGCLDYPLALVKKLEIPEFIIFPNNVGLDAF